MPRQQLKLLNLTLNRPLEEKVPKANDYALMHWLLESACFHSASPLCMQGTDSVSGSEWICQYSASRDSDTVGTGLERNAGLGVTDV